MNEMKIKLVMDAQKNITVTNLTTDKNFVISYTDKTITAPNVYQLLNYQLNSTYTIDSNIEEITDENDKTYFSDIITLLNDITTEINDMAENTDDELGEAEEVEENNDNDFLPFERK